MDMGKITEKIETFVREKFGTKPYIALSPVFEKLYEVGCKEPARIVNRGIDVDIRFHVNEREESRKEGVENGNKKR